MELIARIKSAAWTVWKSIILPILAVVWRRRNLDRPPSAWTDPSTDPIKHVFVLMLENHSFDQMLGCFQDKEKFAKLDGIDRERLRFNKDKDGNKYSQRASENDRAPFDPNHEHPAVVEQLEHEHSGFVRNFQKTFPGADSEALQSVMDYFPKGALPALHWLAENFTICDRWFSSVPGPTWTNRLFLLSGTSMGRVEMGSEENIAGFLGYDQTTIFDLLAKAGIPWRVYFHDFPQSWLLQNQLRKSMISNYFPIGADGDADSLENDLKRGTAAFPRFCLIEPQYFEPGQNDDHPTSSTMEAQRLIARVYNAIRAQEDVWNSSLLIVLYDEHGGFFDHVSPPKAVASAVPSDYPFRDLKSSCDFETLGVRVPAVLISPWVAQGVYSDQMDHTSVLKYVCQKWNLPALSTRADQAADFRSVVQAARRNVAADPIRIPQERMAMQATSSSPENESDHQRALRALCDKIEQDEAGLTPSIVAQGREEYKAEAPPADQAQEMQSRSLRIAAAIRAKGGSGRDSGSDGAKKQRPR